VPAMSIGCDRSDLCTEFAAPCTYTMHTESLKYHCSSDFK